MKEKILSLLKKRFHLPSIEETVYVLRTMGKRERYVFFSLAAVFAISLMLLVWKIDKEFLIDVPIAGGTIKEGVVGTPRFINPLLAISDADRDLADLIYSGLVRPDGESGFILDMARGYEISEDGLEYTFYLKPDLKWHDGEKITTDDVVFTIQQTVDPVVKSPKRAGWEGVDVEKINDETIKFILKKPYPLFLENLAIGIIPKHIWEGAVSEQMPFSEFNIQPIGSGPYMVNGVSRNSSGLISSISLSPFSGFALGKPYISDLTMRFYPSEKDLIKAYQEGKVDAIGGIAPQNIEGFLSDKSAVADLRLPRVFAVFFNQNNAKIFAQKEVREALLYATDKDKIVNNVLRDFGVAINSPIPPGSFGALEEESANSYSLERAREALKAGGWKEGKDSSILEKKVGKETLRLEFSIATSNTSDLKQTAEIIKQMWEPLGMKIDIKIYEYGDLNQNIIRTRKYDALLFGEVVSRDPDPFVFWHSSQRNDPGLNVAMYTNTKVDKLLEEARVSSDPEIRKQKYIAFQQEIKRDIPAIFLFSPNFIYILNKEVKGMNEVSTISVPSERFSQIFSWFIKTDKVWKLFAPSEN